MSFLRRPLGEALLLAVLATLAGLAVNYRLVGDAFHGRLAPPPLSAPVAGLPQPVLLADVRELLAAGAVPVDARDTALYADGHLPGALPLPLGEAETQLQRFREKVAAERVLVVYCSGYGCPDSFDLGMLLLQAGYRDVRVFEGGFPEWRDAGLPVEKGTP